jgi:hypothetical protein
MSWLRILSGLLLLCGSFWRSASQTYSGYVFWAKSDFTSGISGNTDGAHYSTNIQDAINACNSLGSGCAAVGCVSSTDINIKKTITGVAMTTNLLGTYIKNVQGYVILLDLDIHPSNDVFSVSKNDLDCTSYCTSLGSSCIGVAYGTTTAYCWGRSSFVPSSSSGIISYIQVSCIG